MQKVDIAVYVLLGLCIVGFLVGNFLMIDVSLIPAIATGLLGIILGRNGSEMYAATKSFGSKTVGAFKR